MTLKPIRTLFFVTINPNKSTEQIAKIGPSFFKGMKTIRHMFYHDLNRFVKGLEPVSITNVQMSTEIGKINHRYHAHITFETDKMCYMDYKAMRTFVHEYYPKAHFNVIRKKDDIAAMKLYAKKDHFPIEQVENQINYNV